MVAAVVALAALAAALGAGFAALVWRHLKHVEGRALEQETQGAAMRQLVAERDDLRGDVARLELEVDRAGERIDVLDAVLEAARKDLANAAKAAVLDAPAADRGSAADRVLSWQRAQDVARAATTSDRRDPVGSGVPRPGPETPGPRPAWADADPLGRVPDAG